MRQNESLEGHCVPSFPKKDVEFSALLPKQFVVLDLETTGFSPYKDEIIEFGAVRIHRDSNMVTAFKALVRPEGRVPPLITEKSGITQAMVDNEGEPLAIALAGFIDFIGDLPLVAYGASFDMGFLREATKKHGITINNRYTCALRMARCAWPELRSHKLADVAKTRNLPADNPHRALGDCMRTLPIFIAATEIIGAQIVWTPMSVGPGNEKGPMNPPRGHIGTCPMYEPSLAKHGVPDGLLHGEVVVFTGSLCMPRSQAAMIAAGAGCEVRGGVNHQTTMVVVGVQDMSLLAGKMKSSKHLKAEALIAAGQSIHILDETAFMELVSGVSLDRTGRAIRNI